MSRIFHKTPITYYGGKQQLAPRIIDMIPEHRLYAEPFCGGAAIFFAKEPSLVEVLNDTNKELVNFYKVVQNDFTSIEKEVRITLHSRTMMNDAWAIYQVPHLFNEVKRAWAVWVLSSQGFAGQLDGTWGYDRLKNSKCKTIENKKQAFTEELAIRLQNVQLECTDATRIIGSRDSEESFFYCDPPYFNSDMGHYDGYTEEDFEGLLKTLSSIKGKFLMSSYPSDILKRYTTLHGWHSVSVEMNVSASSKGKRKVEVLTANYPIV